jgi:hypothetical protein
VIISWIFFRSADFPTANRMLASMSGAHGVDLTSSFPVGPALAWLVVLWLAVWFLPNTHELLRGFAPALDYPPSGEPAPQTRLHKWLAWQPNARWALLMAVLAIFTLSQMSRISEFIYWQF